MTKERFMQIAEEEGIASSDWKEDLWKAHEEATKGCFLNERDLELACRNGFVMARAQARQTFLEVSLAYGHIRRATRG